MTESVRPEMNFEWWGTADQATASASARGVAELIVDLLHVDELCVQPIKRDAA